MLAGKKMNFTLMPPLEHIAQIRTAITLWNEYDMSTLAKNFSYQSSDFFLRQKEWRVVEVKVIEKVPKLPLPELLKKEVFHFIKLIGLEIRKWMEYHKSFLSEITFIGNRLNWLCWTPQGTVDRKETAKALIKDESLDFDSRYILACIYFLKDDIHALLNQIPENSIKSFCCKLDLKSYKQDDRDLVARWTFDILGETTALGSRIPRYQSDRYSPHQYQFQCSALCGNKVATQYFWQKLTPEEREESLVKATAYVAQRWWVGLSYFSMQDYADILCFLLTQMNEEQQITVFKTYPRRVLIYLLVWPGNSFFLETANYIGSLLNPKDYADVFRDIYRIVKRHCRGPLARALCKILVTKF